MSDRDTDPMDRAYAQSEALLDDAEARAARRARVLVAVAQADATPEPGRSASPPLWRRGGWLVAASVAGVSLFIATRIDQPPSFERPAAPPAAAPPADVPAPAEAPAAAEQAAPPTAPAQPRSAIAAAAPKPAPGGAPPSRAAAEAPVVARDAIPPLALPPVELRIAPPPPPPPPAPAPTSPPTAAPAGAARLAAPPRAPRAAESSGVEEIVVTGSRIEAEADLPRAEPRMAASLRDAAGEGRTREISALLARGAPIDAADQDGETALMKAVQGRQLEAAALLRRRGASLDLRNRAGLSVRDMAAAQADARLNAALGLDR